MILSEVERWLGERGIGRSGGEVVLVACSGGRDSVVLAHATAEVLGARRVVLGHVDHAVRPGSEVDAELVRALAVHLGAESRVVRIDPVSDAEADLRDQRYAALESMRIDSRSELILTAHNLEDQAETVLLQLIRSTEIDALRGIERWRDPILRPLLDVPRSAIAAHSSRHRLAFVDDPTNVEPRYLRNRIRKELLPLLELRYRPRIAERLAAMVRERRMPSLATHATVPAGWEGALSFRLEEWQPHARVPDGNDEAVFDAGVLVAPVVRTLRDGDRIQPFGMSGRTKVSEVSRSRGISPGDRRRMPIVVDEEDRVVWVPGVLRSALAPVGADTTHVWRLRWKNE